MTGTVTTLGGVKAPFLKVVSDIDAAAPSDETENEVIASRAMVFIDPRGTRDSAAFRMVAWPQDNGRWALGVLEEKWPEGAFMQGCPTSHRLWQVQEFNLRSMAENQVKFWSTNKTLGMVRRELLGHREAYEDQVAQTPVLADSAKAQKLPFARPGIVGDRQVRAFRPALVADN